MREILFRGKSVNNGEWYEGSLRIVTYQPADDAPFQQYEIEDTTCGVFPNDFMSGYCETVDPATIGQFTGLYDMHGKRVFEGDILANPVYFRSDKKRGTLLIVEDIRKTDHTALYIGGWKLIGNIHDNPELLEG